MKVLVIGNLGYIGPLVTQRLAEKTNISLTGYDLGLFAHCLSDKDFLPERILKKQIFGDVRNISEDTFKGFDSVVYLAAISNDPMGKAFEKLTYQINRDSAYQCAHFAKKNGVKHFVLASSCSVYGAVGDNAKTEESELNPLTAYAKSKVEAEEMLKSIASESFIVTCFRFATACGMSPRLRLDLVLNDFVAGAIVNKKINIMSDGTPWRPLINVLDMALAIEWGIQRKLSEGGEYLIVNAGSDEWNYQVKDLAQAVAEIIGDVKVEINPNAQPDKRSYRVSFEKFKKLAPDYYPKTTLKQTINDLLNGLYNISFQDENYLKSNFIRLKILSEAIEKGVIKND